MDQLKDILILIDGFLGSSGWFPFALLGVGAFFTIYLKFPQIRYFRHALRIVRGKYDKAEDEGDTSHFQALTTALSGTVGTGNIGGVALAVHLGGPAALFWMLVTAMFGMTTKFVEVTLSHKYREKAEDGTIAGGPMYYMKNRLKLPWLAAIFAIATVLSSFGTGNMPQINNIASSVQTTFNIEPWITGLVLSIFLALVIIGGIKRIAAVTEKLVPSMAILYFLGAFAVILTNYDNIIPSLISIIDSVFTGAAATGGFMGATFAYAFNRGVNRGLFSNEAGQGSAPIAHAAARAHEPVSEGMVAILEPFIDTIIICTVTGMVLLSSGAWKDKFDNVFENTSITILAPGYDDAIEADQQVLGMYLTKSTEATRAYIGESGFEKSLFISDRAGKAAAETDTMRYTLQVREGKLVEPVTFMHNRSVAEDVVIYLDDTPYTGALQLQKDKVLSFNGSDDFTVRGKSLIDSAPLTTEAFKRSFLGEGGKYIVSIGLLLFAFSTALSWSYYGDRAMTYLFGSKSVLYYRIVYVAGFFFAAVADTGLIWKVADITIVLMTLPNLIGIIILHKEVRSTIAQYWADFKKEYPNG